MNEKYMELAAKEVAKAHKTSVEKIYKMAGTDNEFYTVKIERVRPSSITESFGLESKSNTISALPSGGACDCCGGSGRTR